jgi:hypothetical protein
MPPTVSDDACALAGLCVEPPLIGDLVLRARKVSSVFPPT